MSKDAPLWIAVLGVEDGQAVAFAAMSGTNGEYIERERCPGLSPADDPSLGGLLLWMEAGGIGQVWLHPSYYDAARLGQAALLSQWFDPPLTHALAQGSSGPWKRYFRRGVYGARDVVIPSLETRAPWRRASDARTLLRAILRYNAAVETPYQYSPGKTGTQLIRHLHSGPGATKLLICEHLPEIAKTSNLEDVFQWTRAPEVAELAAARYLHVWDKNAQFLGACSSLALGVGDPVRAGDPFALETWPVDGDWLKLAGYWHIRADRLDNAELPDPLRYTVDRAAQRAGATDDTLWVTTPTFRLAHDLHLVRDFLGGWVWPQSHRVLEPWYKVLRDARISLYRDRADEAASVALETVKATYAHTVGWLDLGALRVKEPTDLYRPDWRHAIIAQARCNLWRNVVQANARGACLLAVMQDQVWVLSEEAYAHEAMTAVGLRAGDDLGSYKVKSSAPTGLLRPELDAMREPDAGKRLEAFFRLGTALERVSEAAG